MKKATFVLSVLAAALSALSLLALIVCFFLQRPLAASVYGSPDEVLSLLPIFPVADFVYMLALLLITVLLCVAAGIKTNSIVPDVLFAIALGIGLPALRGILSAVQTVIMTAYVNARGEIFIAANTVALQICAKASVLLPVALAAALLACGISIGCKRAK